MNYKFSKNIRVLFMAEGPAKTPGMIDSLMQTKDLISKTQDLISKSEKSKDPNVKLAYNLLIATGAISTDYIALAKRWYDGSGKSGAEAIVKALINAEKGLPMEIVLYSNQKYTSIPLKIYETQVSADIGQLNGGSITKGLFDLYKAGSMNSFSKETWAKIGIYLKSRGIDGSKAEGSKIITNLPLEDIKKIVGLGNDQINIEKAKIESIINPIIAKFGKDNPRLLEIFEKNKNITFKNGIIDLTPLLEQAKKKGENITDIIKVFEDATKAFEEESKAFEAISKKSLSKVKGRSFKEVILGLFQRKKRDQNGKEISINTKPSEINIGGNEHNKQIDTLSIEDINKVLPKIQQAKIAINADNTNPDKQRHLEEIAEIEKGLVARMNAKESKAKAAQTKDLTTTLSVEQKKGGTLDTVKDIVPKITKRLQSVNAIAIDRSQLDDSLGGLKKYGIYNLETAQKKLNELENPKNEEEIKLKADIIGYIQDNKNLAQKFVIAKKELGNEMAQEIFMDTNRYIGKNIHETYDFKALEKIAILTDPESTPGQRAFARLEPGKTVSMQKLIEGEMQSSIISSPEIASMNVTMNASGGFDIPLLKETNLTKPQVQEYITNMALYADLGLSQLIPHIPLITTELRNKGINTSIDGSTNTMEQQQVLKEIYGLLFGKKIETNNLGDVERAFVSSAGNPTSMKNAMQHTLKIHHLIGESGQAIAPDTLQKWIRGTQESTPNKADLLANIQ